MMELSQCNESVSQHVLLGASVIPCIWSISPLGAINETLLPNGFSCQGANFYDGVFGGGVEFDGGNIEEDDVKDGGDGGDSSSDGTQETFAKASPSPCWGRGDLHLAYGADRGTLP